MARRTFTPSRSRKQIEYALGGRSSRTYFTEGLWEKVLAAMKPGDFVLVQFGHNDGGERFKGTRPRASLKGAGDETDEGVVEQTGQREVIHTYGWYLRKYIADSKAKGAMPIVLSPVPRDIWRDGKVSRAANDYGKWAKEAAQAGGAQFVDLNEIIAKHYEEAGAEKVQTEYFTAADHTHTTLAGAKLNAACVVAGLRALKDCPLTAFLADKAEALSSRRTELLALQPPFALLLSPHTVWQKATIRN